MAGPIYVPVKTLLSVTVTTAVTTLLSDRWSVPGSISSVTLQGAVVYGSGGTSIDAWIQTSLDGGTTWIDITNFRWTTASAVKVCNLVNLTPVTTQFAPTDGTMTANTCKDGVLGPLYRVKYTTVGTYAGATTLKIDAAFKTSAIA